MRDITELPHDLFLIVASYLSPRACVRSRAVSRRWYAAFTDEHISLLLLRWNFPRCRELRLAAAAAFNTTFPTGLPRNLKAELTDVSRQPHNWSLTFADVTRRYFNLSKGQPRSVEKLDLAVSDRENGSIFSFYGVAPWNRFLRLNEKTSNFHYPDPVWSYSQEDGVLVYPAATSSDHELSTGSLEGCVYRILDPSTGQRVVVPFDVRSRHIRRVRLAQGVLIIEWAEALPYHQLNDREVVHRHFVTAFDVTRRPSTSSLGNVWSVEFRSEWKLHFLGLPLNRSDRFFSAHTARHYAVYFWQPNRSLYQDDPIEQLAVWDITTPSPYRPSEDPKGDKRPVVARAPSLPTGLWNGQNSSVAGKLHGQAGTNTDFEKSAGVSLATATAGPQVIRRMAWRELDFYGLRQRTTPRLRSLALDERNLYVIEEEHRWADGQHSSLSPPRVHFVRSTGIPVVPMPTTSPRAAHSITSRSATELNTDMAQIELKPVALSTIVDGPVHGPMWVDAWRADGDVNMNFCWRVADANGAASSSTTQNALWLAPPRGTAPGDRGNGQRPKASPKSGGWPWALGAADPLTLVVSTESTRWPGWAPCWRHEDFPYLTVAEMVDYAAGVRVTARHCFILETLSVHVRPAVAVKGTPSATAEQEDGGAGDAVRRFSSANAAAVRSEEVSFPDEMWSELVAKGQIAGDERWVVGEDARGRITILRF
ncbi:hypothetical protein NEMBOFW57_003054 [Staphylotrichum longicolle]|uniref:F-box domain-containing protein n=1 Tax=Staphylotrichum longicolle TaxID=669026 RepID=A0AAD4F4L5_9PEZI|nr:hypothetical protein NEMBOFW57_003054 [Staphylotrichum longicolle]